MHPWRPRATPRRASAEFTPVLYDTDSTGATNMAQAGRKGRQSLGFIGCIALVGALALAADASAAVKKVPYPEVKVELAAPYQPDATFNAMIAKFSAAVAGKDQNALF